MVQASRVELIEFHISHPTAGAPSYSNTVTARAIRIRSILISLAGTACCQDHSPRGYGFDAVAAGVQYMRTDAAAIDPN